MTHSSSQPSSSQSDDAFDLSQIFIGREQQLDLFQIYLNRWKQLNFEAEPDDTDVLTRPSPNNKIQCLIVLICGRGGIGKSTLLKRYRDIALKENQHILSSKAMVSEIIDWEFAIEGKRSLFNPPEGQEVDITEYFGVLRTQLALVLHKKVDEFKNYKKALENIKDAKNQVNRVLEAMQKDAHFPAASLAAGEGIVKLIRWVAPRVGQVLQLDNEKVAGKVKEVVGKGVEIGAEQLVHLYTKLQDSLGASLDDYLDPTLRLGLGLGRDLREFARNFPLLIFFDTYEEIDKGDHLLKIIMGAAGLRVGWVIAGRGNLWAGIEQRKRSVALEYGYKDIVSSDRALSIDFNTGSVGPFTIGDIKEYFDLLCQHTQYSPPLPNVTMEETERLWDVTKGVPLAVKIATGLYMDTANVDTITEHVEGKREIIDQMVLRYLLHARDYQIERDKLYGLAMLRRADQVKAVAAALGLKPEEVKTSYVYELSRLQRRYSFIFTEKEEPALHQEVRHFLRLWLLEHCKEPQIVAISEHLSDTYKAILENLEKRTQYNSLRERLQDDEWVGAYLDLTEQKFWFDPFEGVYHILPFMIAAAIYRRNINGDVAKIGAFFETHIKQPYRDWWRWAKQSLVYTNSKDPSVQKLAGLEKLADLISQRPLTFPQPFQDCQAELEAALCWRLGEAHEDLEWYEKALTRLEYEAELREAAARTCCSIGDKLYEEKKFAESIPFLNRAVTLKPDYTNAYYSRGWTYIKLSDYKWALEDHNRAIELDPKAARFYTGRGWTYTQLGDYERALEDHNRAIKLDPKNAGCYTGRGNTYTQIWDYERALEDHNRAIELDPKNAYSYRGRGYTYTELKDYQRALEDYNRAIELDPKNGEYYSGRGFIYSCLKEYERALEDCDHAIELNPASNYVYGQRGAIYVDIKEYQRAIQDFNHSATLVSTISPALYYNRGVAYLHLGDIKQAKADLRRRCEMKPVNLDAALLVEWISMGKQRPDIETAERLERIAKADLQHYVSFLCRGLALGLRGKLKLGLVEIEKAIPLVAVTKSSVHGDGAEAYFWKGILCAYYYQGRYEAAIEAIEKSLALDLRPILLTPLYWLEKDRPDFFEQYARSSLERYNL